ncbi:MAG: hypothetical protein ACQEVA_15710 [Myxococcota bacterium]
MAKCDLSVVLDEPNRTFEPGDRVTGRVVVDVDKAVRCDGLTVTHQWKTHGRGNVDRGAVGAETLFAGEWEPGRYEYAFDFGQPPGPETYHGHNLNVDWYVHATADIPWALDPDAEVDHLVRYTGSPQDYQVGNPETVQNAGRHRQGCGGCVAIFGGMFLVPGVLALVVAWTSAEVEALFVGLILSAIGGFLIWSGVSRRLAEKKLGDVEVTLVPAHVHPGGDVRCVVTIRPPKLLEINCIQYTFAGEEVVVRGSGTNSRTYRHQLHEDIEVDRWGEQKTLQAGVEHTFEQAFTIPVDAPPSFDSADDNKLEWWIQTEVDIPTWPDWSTRNLMIVVPGDAGSTGESSTEHDSEPEKPDDWW